MALVVAVNVLVTIDMVEAVTEAVGPFSERVPDAVRDGAPRLIERLERDIVSEEDRLLDSAACVIEADFVVVADGFEMDTLASCDLDRDLVKTR